VRPGRSQAACGYAVVDLEASGSSSRRHRVVELAVVLLDADLEPQGEFATLIDPQGPVGPTHIHGIEAAHLAGAPLFSGVAARLLRLLAGRVLVGHNVGCDRAFLAAEFARLGVELPPVPELCTMRLAAGAGDRAAAGLSLAACAGAAGLTGWCPHTALGDARATAALLAHYAPRASGLPELLAAAAALRWPAAPVAAAGPAAGDALWVGRPLTDRPAVGRSPAERPLADRPPVSPSRAVPAAAAAAANGAPFGVRAGGGTSGRGRAPFGVRGGGGADEAGPGGVPDARKGRA
jgi:DNA polymerase-3 subunit epsilon